MSRPKSNLKKQVWVRDKRCLICGTKELLTVDHLVKVENGGENTLENLRTLCRPCHEKKDIKHLFVFDFEENCYKEKIFKAYKIV